MIYSFGPPPPMKIDVIFMGYLAAKTKIKKLGVLIFGFWVPNW